MLSCDAIKFSRQPRLMSKATSDEMPSIRSTGDGQTVDAGGFSIERAATSALAWRRRRGHCALQQDRASTRLGSGARRCGGAQRERASHRIWGRFWRRKASVARSTAAADAHLAPPRKVRLRLLQKELNAAGSCAADVKRNALGLSARRK